MTVPLYFCCKAPAGQHCTRAAGHDGPCAVVFEAEPMFNPSMREAWALTHGERRAAYGTPSQVFAGYAKMWSGLLARKLREDLDANDVTLCMTALKLAREANCPKNDNITDAHGYLIIHDEIKGE